MEWTDINVAKIHLDCKDCVRSTEKVHTNYLQEEVQEDFNLFRLARVHITRIPNEISRHRRVRDMGTLAGPHC